MAPFPVGPALPANMAEAVKHAPGRYWMREFGIESLSSSQSLRRRMRKKARHWGYAPSERALATAGCLMLNTSLEAEPWPAEQVLSLYRRRWQAELG